MSDSIDQARRDVHCAFEEALAWAERDGRRSFFEYERQAWTLMLALGRALVVLFLAHQARRPRPVEYRHEGNRYRLDGERTSELGTRFGKVSFTRPKGCLTPKQRGKCDLPVDRELKLCSGFSLGVVLDMTRLCAQMAYASARATHREFCGWAPSPRAVMRMIDGAGEEARPFLEQAPPPKDDGEILVIEVDAKGAPMISEQEHQRRSQPHQAKWAGKGTRRHARRRRRRAQARPRRTKGKKSKNAKMAFVGAIYTLKTTPDGMEGPIEKRLYATFESHEELFIWLLREAQKRGYGNGTKECFFLADGSDHIWRLQERYFGEAEPCVDWYHIVEKLWTAGACLHREGSREQAEWVCEQANRLRRGAASAVLEELRQRLAEIPRTGPGNKGKRKRLGDIIKHYRKNLARMRYDVLRARDLVIGTGVIEGAVRHLVGFRLDCPGRWGRLRSEKLLRLRCILLNGQWDEFTEYLAKRRGLALPAQPQPTVTHDAKKAA